MDKLTGRSWLAFLSIYKASTLPERSSAGFVSDLFGVSVIFISLGGFEPESLQSVEDLLQDSGLSLSEAWDSLRALPSHLQAQ
jgi:hypothetical protein